MMITKIKLSLYEKRSIFKIMIDSNSIYSGGIAKLESNFLPRNSYDKCKLKDLLRRISKSSKMEITISWMDKQLQWVKTAISGGANDSSPAKEQEKPDLPIS